MRFTRIKGRKELSILSGTTLANSLNNRLFPSLHHSEASVPKRDPLRSRRARVKKRVGHLLHLSKPGLTMADPAVEKREPQTEIVDEREENVQVSDDSVTCEALRKERTEDSQGLPDRVEDGPELGTFDFRGGG